MPLARTGVPNRSHNHGEFEYNFFIMQEAGPTFRAVDSAENDIRGIVVTQSGGATTPYEIALDGAVGTQVFYSITATFSTPNAAGAAHIVCVGHSGFPSGFEVQLFNAAGAAQDLGAGEKIAVHAVVRTSSA